jgi:adenylylsulfate reductase subunit B
MFVDMLTLLLWGTVLELDEKKKKGPSLGTTKDFVSPITTKPWGKFIPKLAEGEKPNEGEINSQRLYTEPQGLNIDGELPSVPKDSFKKGVYY